MQHRGCLLAHRVVLCIDMFYHAGGIYIVGILGASFNDDCCLVDWLLTVPLLLIQPVLGTTLPMQEALDVGWTL